MPVIKRTAMRRRNTEAIAEVFAKLISRMRSDVAASVAEANAEDGCLAPEPGGTASVEFYPRNVKNMKKVAKSS